MKLKNICIKGFKSLEYVDLPLNHLTVCIGANGSGKSNLLSAFYFLHRIAEGRFSYAIAKAGGAHSLLYNGPDTTKKIEFTLTFEEFVYHAACEPSSDDNLVFIQEDIKRPQTFPGGVREVSHAKNPPGYRESILIRLNYDLLDGKKIKKFLSDTSVYHFHDTSDTSGARLIGPISDNFSLKPDASNLAAYLYLIMNQYPQHFELIQETVRLAAPFFHTFILRPTAENQEMIRLAWQEEGSDTIFQGHQMSDGLLRFTSLVTLLMQPVELRPSIIIIDEPELGLHPVAIDILAGLMKSASAHNQVLITTQSPLLLNQFTLDEIRIIERKHGYSTIRTPDQEALKEWLEDYSPAELWQSGLLGGDPSVILR
ncbi:conserved hypothetical protein [Methanospirillum hungatei JF-1]|jgi:predicted ATPase|uniref:ATPase AAA-type core domain-containing protein n=1 Tax=Methanospirillum hungatei JF-1 (strain ATCC 27890 / DSM 864 / NBRC 100397 / JF-1) TaxID=323259 RepID=Q2FMP9_METHJ|nr:AAA family ATPase [Methanospirillum hungatei]ABD40829.1 conserved hypothetical protein [Methanospirillum hungatei JF-1]